ncbi:hypothetical protein [Rhodococcus sp. IEGM 1379]|uniref:DUF7620 family protein n=1 Tax=Rhodococcus sp. IEGM 1379 TaxID=3047086 RepID=UPI0024B82394|nr:hypothetical protein [Rhodococcus sp. IEGM 1379]MDI9914362.1 hypothetical protein [Rhodococcus sp. IEGM 1379]
MKWPWAKRCAKELDTARSQAREAAEEHAYSTQQRIDAEQEKHLATKVARKQRRQLELNGWTELLRQSMGGAQ